MRHGTSRRTSTIYIEAVHRLSSLGAVVTHVAHGTSREGFDAEWREITILTLEGDLISRCEVFDEADLDAALARFDELNRPAPRLENTASQVGERLLAHIAAHDWDALANTMTDDFAHEDRRQVIGSGLRLGRDATSTDLRAVAELGFAPVRSTIIATRGERLYLMNVQFTEHAQGPDAFLTEILVIGEANSDNRLIAGVVFDPDDIDAAFEELNARYVAGEAAPYSQAWSVVSQAYAAFNRGEMFPTTPDWVNFDHRRGTPFAPGEMAAYFRAIWDVTPEENVYIEAVHRLSSVGAVVTHAAHWTSPEGFAAEWRVVDLLTVQGDLITRVEFFDEIDLDAAIARFDELNQPTPLLENAASQVYGRFQANFLARDWTAVFETLAADHYSDDRRRVVGAGLRRGREAEIEDLRAATAEFGTMDITSSVIAIRGDRLALRRARYSDSDKRPGAFYSEVVHVIELDVDQRIAALVFFDPDDMTSLSPNSMPGTSPGEGAAHAHTWSVIDHADLRRVQPARLAPTTPDWVNIDHRRGISVRARRHGRLHP